jgi:anti-anti-sigma factor
MAKPTHLSIHKSSKAKEAAESFNEAAGEEAFHIEHIGEIVVLVPSSAIESLQWELIEEATEILVAPIAAIECPQVIVDLKKVKYFGSVFLSLLLRLERSVRKRGGAMVICSASPGAAELLKVTNLDTIWAIYDTREEAVSALGGD